MRGLSPAAGALLAITSLLGACRPAALGPASQIELAPAGEERLIVAASTPLELWLDLPEQAELRIDRVATRDGAGSLTVELERESGDESSLGEFASGAVVAVELPGGAGPARLRLAASGNAGVLVLGKPRLVLNGVSVDTAAPSPIAVAPKPALSPTPPVGVVNVLIYLVDTLRTDHLGAFGYRRDTSPRLDAFARQSTVFERAQAQSSWTRASVASLFTGLGPWQHATQRRNHSLADQFDTLAERFRAAGYETQGWITNPNVARSFQFAQGFDGYYRFPGGKNSAEEVNQGVAGWLANERRAASDSSAKLPFFAYVHTVEPHAPYRPAPAWLNRFGASEALLDVGTLRFLRQLQERQQEAKPEVVRQLVDLYDAEVAQNDAAFGALVDTLESAGLRDSTIVVFVSDHGEEFHEHGGFEHAKTLYQEQLRVPLLIRVPGQGGRRVDVPIQHADLLPTLLDLAGLPALAGLEGRSLRSLIESGGSSTIQPRELISNLDLDGVESAAILRWPWKLVHTTVGPRAGERELFDLQGDPGETRNVAAEKPFLVRYLAARLAQRLAAGRAAGAPAAETPEDAELHQDLKALGYLQ